MGIATNHVSVGTSATEIVPSDPTEYRTVFLHDPTSGASVFVGDSSVTTSDGFELEGGTSETFPLEPGESLYGIVASGTQTVSYYAT